MSTSDSLSPPLKTRRNIVNASRGDNDKKSIYAYPVINPYEASNAAEFEHAVKVTMEELADSIIAEAKRWEMGPYGRKSSTAKHDS